MTSIIKRLTTVALFAVALFLAPALLGGITGLHMGTAYAIVQARTGGTDGVTLSGSSTPQGMFGNASLQPTNPAQAPASFALGISAVAVYSSAQVPAAVNANTTAEQAFTVTGVAAGSLIHCQRISAAQAGLGIVGARVSAANTVQVNYCNVTAGNITPTAENLLFVEIRGPLVQTVALAGFTAVPTLSTLGFSVSLSGSVSSVTGTNVQGLSSAQVSSLPSVATAPDPSSVAPNFTVTNPSNSTPPGSTLPATQPAGSPVVSGLPQTVIVNKPTGQAGLGYWAWVAGNGTLGLTYSNTSGGGITPTAETYRWFACRGIALHGPVHYLVNWGAAAAVNTVTAPEQTFTVNGLAVGDTVLAVNRATDQAGLAIGQCRVTAANTLGIKFINPTAGNITPTASEVVDVVVDKARNGLGGAQSGAVLAQFSGTVAVGAIAAVTGGEVAVAVTGILSGAPVIANVSAGSGFAAGLGLHLPAGVIFGGARASGAGVLQLNFINVTAGALAAAATGTAQFTVLQAPTGTSGAAAGAAGSAVVYPVDNQAQQIAENAAAQSLASQALGFQAGS